MILLGTIVNAAAIAAGTAAGMLLPKMSERYQRTVTQGLGLALCVLGVMMALKTEHYLFVVISLAAGGFIGEWIDVEKRFEAAGCWLERRVVGQGGGGDVGKAFVTSSLLFCIGAMAILGAIDGGIRNNHDILYTKALMDGILSVIFASALGFGVAFSAIAVFLYQGAIAIVAAAAASHLSEAAIRSGTVEVSAVGGILILGIGINMLELQKIRVANLLPSILVMAVLIGVSMSL